MAATVGPVLAPGAVGFRRRSWRPQRFIVRAGRVDLLIDEPATRINFAVEVGVDGENLRKVLLEKKADLYDLYGKVMNCGGGGSCGTCIVNVVEGASLLSEKSDAEENKLKGRPASWRLACQSVINCKASEDGPPAKLTIQPRPQTRK